MPEKPHNLIERPPVIAIMGHVDHGKSTLLDYIRKSNIVDSEAGGITQRISAYEVVHKTKDGKEHKITFLDTPGHEAFTAIRSRGAKVADIAILVVSAEDGVKPQTVEALNSIKTANVPYIVAINKIDKEGADVDRTKGNLAEHEIYVEGYGGTIPYVPISAKTGQGINDLLDMMLLQAEVEELKADRSKLPEGVIIEANLDKKKGLSASIIIKNGTLKSGMTVVAGSALSPVRMLENFLGKPIKEASFSSPVRLIGWNELPQVGMTIKAFVSKKEAEEYALSKKNAPVYDVRSVENDEITTIPVVVKANEAGGLDAVIHEIKKIKNDRVKVRIIHSGVGDIAESDVKIASGRANTIILGFSTKVDNSAKPLAEKMSVNIQVFDIIYKLSEWLENVVTERTPKNQVEESTGTAKVLKIFSKIKDKQILGGRVEKGSLVLNAEVKIMRRDFEIGSGKVRELQKQKTKVQQVPEGEEFGTLIESKIEIAPGDRLESFIVVEK
ncbi:translation initiation factor IF-2 [Patescibacteria group bacterium]|nr:translation initiation factor IF-2 [Patescibacteria group bacterium]